MPYIFVVRRNADRSARAIIADRFSAQLWPMNGGTPHQASIEKGDKIVLYVAGAEDPDGHSFVATGLAQGRRVQSERGGVGSRPPWLSGLTRELYDVPVGELCWLDVPVPLKPLRHELGFIRRPDRWGNYIQSGVVKISVSDYARILRTAGDDRLFSDENE